MKVLVFPEDGSEYAAVVLENVFLAGARAAVSRPINRRLLEFVPVARSAARSGMWMARKGSAVRDRDEMCAQIAEHITRDTDRFVLFHFDSDCRWSERDTCEKIQRFERDVVTRVARFPRDPKDVHGKGVIGVEEAGDKIVCMVPFWSIESWLYMQSDVALVELSAGEYGFDEIAFPVKACSVGRTSNEPLSRRVDGRKLAAFSASFAEFVRTLRENRALADTLLECCWRGDEFG